VVAAEFVNGQRTLQGIWFEHQAGEGAYYTPEGRSLRRAFLRSPMEVSRVTSGFTNARFHPILQQMRAHRGIDYGAPVGTPVRAVANGTVEFAGRQGGYGNVVILAHPNNITTLYAHLNGFPAKVRKGARVSQGEVIGQVGMTGLTSGPHLHYEFRIAGQHVDPLRVALPEAPPITPALRAAFEAATAGPIARLQLLRGSNLARLE
jgi:murein DD-endopeptidase MepM/ murein hydrolase activator NlpD